jgi:hypothetical protein
MNVKNDREEATVHVINPTPSLVYHADASVGPLPNSTRSRKAFRRALDTRSMDAGQKKSFDKSIDKEYNNPKSM